MGIRRLKFSSLILTVNRYLFGVRGYLYIEISLFIAQHFLSNPSSLLFSRDEVKKQKNAA